MFRPFSICTDLAPSGTAQFQVWNGGLQLTAMEVGMSEVPAISAVIILNLIVNFHRDTTSIVHLWNLDLGLLWHQISVLFRLGTY